MLGLLAVSVASAFSAYAEGVCIGVAAYSIAKGIGKANFSFKK